MSEYSTPPLKRARTSRSDLLREPREELVERCLKLQAQVETLSSQATQKLQGEDFAELKDMCEKLRSQNAESSQRESILVMRLTAKEQEVQDLLTQLQELKESRCPGSTQLQALLLDPAVNLLFESFKKELDSSKTQLKQAQDDLAAFKFTPDSHIGKRLMAKCRLLLNENEELGRTISSGSVAKLESTIALEKKLIQEMRKAEKDTEFFLYDLNDEMEAMQATIYQLQQELKEARENLCEAQEENKRLQAALPSSTNVPAEVASGVGQVSTETAATSSLAKRTDANCEDAGKVKRTSSSTNAKAKSRHSDKKDSSFERTSYKTSDRNRNSSSHGNQVTTTTATKGNSKPSVVRQGDLTNSAALPGRPEESSNGGRHGSAEKTESTASETHGASTEKLRSASERESQRQQRTSNNSSSSKTDSAGSEPANGLISKHSVLTDSGQKA